MQTQYLGENLYMLDDGMVRQFFIVGPDKVLLLDTGFAGEEVLAAVRAVSSAPIQVLLTHGDPDHAGGLDAFARAWLHEKDWHLVEAATKLHPLQEGDTFLCGDWKLQVIEIPGHTYGSVAFADFEKKVLFAGDSVQKAGPIYLFGSHRNLNLYIESQKKLEAMADRFETIYPCHHACPVTPDFIGKNRLDAEALQAGTLPSEPTPGMPCRTYHGQWTDFYCTEADRTRA